jgi:hypothetical protein
MLSHLVDKRGMFLNLCKSSLDVVGAVSNRRIVREYTTLKNGKFGSIQIIVRYKSLGFVEVFDISVKTAVTWRQTTFLVLGARSFANLSGGVNRFFTFVPSSRSSFGFISFSRSLFNVTHFSEGIFVST